MSTVQAIQQAANEAWEVVVKEQKRTIADNTQANRTRLRTAIEDWWEITRQLHVEVTTRVDTLAKLLGVDEPQTSAEVTHARS